jgi:hypothetical protein
LLALAAVLLNAWNASDHPLQALAEGQRAVAGVDGMLLLTALLAAWTCRRLHQARAPELTPGEAENV